MLLTTLSRCMYSMYAWKLIYEKAAENSEVSNVSVSNGESIVEVNNPAVKLIMKKN